MNPFSGATIELPPIMDLSELEPSPENNDDSPLQVEFEVTKTILSADPALFTDDYIVTIIYGGCNNLAFIWAGDEAWTYIDKRFMSVRDIMYFKGHIFAVDSRNRVLMIDVNGRPPQVEVIASQANNYSQQTYLVESSSGDLLLVKRFLDIGDDSQHATSVFKVFKLLLEQFEQGWLMRLEVKNLDGDTLFLGDNYSICVSTSKWPGCQANSIYYTDDYSLILYQPPSGRRDIGIFNIENGNFGTHYIIDSSHNHMPPSIWIVPTVLGNFV
ncbi:F-box protein SKIP23-like [Cornus florida]|uniref:F-box protein SKIP23-like n=1 Tax=Cornus florida TaxID=4283 RepID=UPI00289929D0|nr:F-box protein SKIP23-like [Cornus florida]